MRLVIEVAVTFFCLNQKQQKTLGDNLTSQLGWHLKVTLILYHIAHNFIEKGKIVQVGGPNQNPQKKLNIKIQKTNQEI